MGPDPNPLFHLGESCPDFERSRDSDDAKAACTKFQTFASLILSFIHFVLMRCLPDGFLKWGFMKKKLGPIPFWKWIRAILSFAFKGCQKILVSLEPKSIGSMSPGFHWVTLGTWTRVSTTGRWSHANVSGYKGSGGFLWIFELSWDVTGVQGHCTGVVCFYIHRSSDLIRFI